MNNEKYKLTIRILCLCLSAIAFLISLSCMIFYLVVGGKSIFSVFFLPTLVISIFFTVATTLLSFINLASKLGKVALLLDIISILFIIISFISLYR